MDLNQIAVFVRVVDKGSFTLAAKFLKQPKSKVSRYIAALEQELGTPLLYRSTRQLSLTEAGTHLYEKTKEHIYGLEGVNTNGGGESGEVSGVLKLTAAEDLGSMLLGPFVAELTKLHPGLRVSLHLSNNMVDLVKEGMDVAIRIGEMEDTSLKAKLIGWISFILVASPHYLKKVSEIKTVSDLSDHPALNFSPEGELQQWILFKDRKQHKVKINALCSANNPKTLLDIAIAGRGVALIPEFLCVDGLLHKKLVRVLPGYSTKPVPVHFVWPDQKGNNPKLRACLDFGTPYLGKYFS